MDIIIAKQIALDGALVAPANRLKIGKSNLRLSSDLKSKEATLQVFWATAIVHHHSIRFKMNNKKHIVNFEYFREMLQICPKLPNQQFEELLFEEAIITFLRDLGHSVINKCLSGKSTGYDSLRLSQAQILWGMYHQKKVDYAYLLWEDFVYQVENKNVKRSNEMYYPRFTKVIVNFFMTKDQSIPRQNSVNWHYARDDYMFTMIKTTTSSTTKGKRLKTLAKIAKPAKKKQPANMDKDEGIGAIPGVSDVPTYNSDDEQISWKSSDEEDDDEVSPNDNQDDQDDDANDDA
ncbi:hypothetical protein Tco_0345181 [Tanacetum coccineum]